MQHIAMLLSALLSTLPCACRGRWFAWGFPDVAGATRAVVQAPPGTYVAAFRGFEGKPLPKHLGGYKKRCGCSK